jgi:hypothetical protein
MGSNITGRTLSEGINKTGDCNKEGRKMFFGGKTFLPPTPQSGLLMNIINLLAFPFTHVLLTVLVDRR